MAAHVTAITAPARCGKTRRMLAGYREALALRMPGSTLWLAPTWRAAAAVRQQLLDGRMDGCLSPGVMTFDQFAEAVLRASTVPVRPLSGMLKRQLVRRLLDDQLAAGRLRHFRPIARSGGLVDLVCDFIRELKRLDIWPDRFRSACEARGMTAKDSELLAIYDAYQRCLTEHNLYDAEGRFWSARALLRDGHWRPLERLRLVVVDGFADFTPPQHEIFELLAERVEELLITLPLEADSQRLDLFSKPLRTLAELRRRHPGLMQQQVDGTCHVPTTLLDHPNESAAWPAMDHLERTLFVNPRALQPASETSDVEILAASRQLGEVELIGSRIKRLLCASAEKPDAPPARPGDIAVVFRSLEDVEELVREVFGRLGIPFALESGQTLDRSTALAALVGLIRLDVEDWPFRQLLAVLSNNYFQPEWPQWQEGKAAAAAERAIRRFQIPRVRDRLLEQLRREAGRPTTGDQPAVAGHRRAPCGAWSVGRGDRTQQARLALGLLMRLKQAFDQLPQRATLGQWAAAWQELAAETGLLRTIEQGSAQDDPQSGLSDRAAWARLQEVLSSEDRLAQWLDRDPPQMDRQQALDVLLDMFGSVRVRHQTDESGRVRILSAPSARALKIPYLFFAGLAEQLFPLAEREDRLYSEAEYRRLIDEGLPLSARSQRSRDEMLLFYEVMTRATRRLYFSYPALDEAAQPLSPSPYLEEVEQACGPGRIPRTEAPDLSPIPAHDEPLTAAEFRVKAVSTALEGDAALLAGLIRREPSAGLAGNVLAGLLLIHQRQHRDGFSPAEGILSGPAARRRISARFGPDTTFSATELEQYASCPFRFFIEGVLGLEPVEDLTLKVDYLARGRLVHDALAAFHQRINQAYGGPTSPAALNQAEYDRLLAETLQELFRHRGGSPLENVLGEVDRRLWLRWAADYRQQHQSYDELWKNCDQALVPTWFEVSFGRAGRGSPSIDRPLELACPGGPIRISGRIDRIDIGTVAGQTVFNILDYKTGTSTRFSPEAVEAGTALQLPLYAMAAEELLLADRHAVGWRAGYWHIQDKGFRPKQALQMATEENGRLEQTAEWKSRRQTVVATVGNLINAIRKAEFPVSSGDERCTSYCPFSTICRINQVRSLGKKWQPSPNQA